MIKMKAPKGTVSVNWNGTDLKVDKKGYVDAPDEAMGDLLEHGCIFAQETLLIEEIEKAE